MDGQDAAEAEKHRTNKILKCFVTVAGRMERKFESRSVVDGRYVSVVRDAYMDTRGAHPNTDVNTILWDKTRTSASASAPFSPRHQTTA